MRALTVHLALAGVALACGDPPLVFAPPGTTAKTQVLGEPDGRGATVIALDDPDAALFGPLEAPVLHALFLARSPAALGLTPGPLASGLTGLRLPPPDEVREWRDGAWSPLTASPLIGLRTALEIPACSDLGGCYVAGDRCAFDCVGLEAPAAPAPPNPPAPPGFRPCSAGWREALVGTTTVCAPRLADADCRPEQLAFPGATECLELDRAGYWPDLSASPLPALYVDGTVPTRGAGDAPSRALQSLGQAVEVAAGRAVHVALAPGEHGLVEALPPGSILEGVSPDRVTLRFAVAPVALAIRRVRVELGELAETASVAFERVRARGALRVGAGGYARFEESVLDSTGALVIEGHFELRRGRFSLVGGEVIGVLRASGSQLTVRGTLRAVAGGHVSLVDSVVTSASPLTGGGFLEGSGADSSLSLRGVEVRADQPTRCARSCALVRVENEASTDLERLVVVVEGIGSNRDPIQIHGGTAQLRDVVLHGGEFGIKARELSRLAASRLVVSAAECSGVWTDSTVEAVSLVDVAIDVAPREVPCLDGSSPILHQGAGALDLERVAVRGGEEAIRLLGISNPQARAPLSTFRDLDVFAPTGAGVTIGPMHPVRVERAHLSAARMALRTKASLELRDANVDRLGPSFEPLVRVCGPSPRLERIRLRGAPTGPLLDLVVGLGDLVARDVSLEGHGLVAQLGSPALFVERLRIFGAPTAVTLAPIDAPRFLREELCDQGLDGLDRQGVPSAAFAPGGGLSAELSGVGRCFDAPPELLGRLPLTALRATDAADCARPGPR